MFTGSNVALVTPMTADGEIDWVSFDQLIEWQIQEGTKGITVLGTTGESTAVTPAERLALTKRAVAVVAGRIPVIAGAGTNATQSSIELTEQVQSLGVDGILLVTPYYNRPPQEGLYAHFKKVAQSTSLPVILYNVPARTGCDLLPETVARLATVSNIVAVKEATGELGRIAQYRDAGCEIDLLSGDDSTAEQFILCGGRGVISVAANVAPRLMSELAEAALKSDSETSGQLHNKLMPLFDALSLQSNPIPVKWAAAKMNLIPSGIRLPLLGLESAYHDSLSKAMRHADLIQ